MIDDGANPLLTANATLLESLDAFSRTWELNMKKQGAWTCNRKRIRREFRTTCDIWYFETATAAISSHSALTRNLSEGGISLVARCRIKPGTPIEIFIHVSRQPPVYLAGIVRFCRAHQQGFCEIGVELMQHQATPIFAHNPEDAATSVPWIRDALHLAVPPDQSASSAPSESKTGESAGPSTDEPPQSMPEPAPAQGH